MSLPCFSFSFGNINKYAVWSKTLKKLSMKVSWIFTQSILFWAFSWAEHKHITCDFRIETSSELRGNEFTSGKMVENHSLCLFACHASYLYNSKSRFQLLPLFCHGCGTGCFWAAISILVRFYWFVVVYFYVIEISGNLTIGKIPSVMWLFVLSNTYHWRTFLHLLRLCYPSKSDAIYWWWNSLGTLKMTSVRSVTQ